MSKISKKFGRNFQMSKTWSKKVGIDEMDVKKKEKKKKQFSDGYSDKLQMSNF